MFPTRTRARLPEGLEDVSKVPSLVAELLRRGWSDQDLKAALGNNLLRVLKRAEEVSRRRTQTRHSESVFEILKAPCKTAIHPSSVALPMMTSPGSSWVCLSQLIWGKR